MIKKSLKHLLSNFIHISQVVLEWDLWVVKHALVQLC